MKLSIKISILAAILLGYFIFILFTITVGHTDFTFWDLLPERGTPLREGIYASAFEDAVFFTLVSLMAILAGTPTFQILDTRLQHVYSNKKSSDRIKSVIRNDAIELGIYSPHTLVEMNINAYSEDLDAFQIEISVVVQLASAIPDCNYTKTRIIELVFDDFGDMENKPYGELKWIQTTSSKTGAPDIQIKTPCKFFSKKDNFSILEKIHKDESSTIQFHYWIWAKNKEIFSYCPARKTENFNLHIVNHIKDDICLQMIPKDIGDKEVLRLSKAICKDEFMLETDSIDFILSKH